MSWIIFAFLIWLGLLVYAWFMPEPKGFFVGSFERTLWDVWHGGLFGWPINATILAFWSAVIPFLVVGLPLFLIGVPVLMLSAMVLGGLAALASFMLLIFSPLIFVAGSRAAVYWVLGKYLTTSEQREATEDAVKAALGLSGGTVRKMTNQAARIMDAEEFAEVTARPRTGAGVLLGKAFDEPFIHSTEKHLFVMASTRGGKGVYLILPNLQRYPGSVFVLDPKGENAAATYQARQAFGKVQVLDPFGVSGLPVARFNPLARLLGPMAVTDAQMMADALVEGKDDHWNSSARGLLTGLILHVATAPSIQTRDLPTVRSLLMGDLAATLEDMTRNANAPQEVRDVGAWGMGAAEDEWSSIVSNAIEQTKWLASPQIADCLRSGGDQVDFSAYRDSVQSVFVCLPAPYFRTFNKWLRLVVAASLDTLTKQLNPDMPLPTRFVLDELAQLGTLEKVESALTLSAGYGVQLWGIWQHIGDIKRCYPNSGIGGWMSSSGVRLVFATHDNESISYFAKMTGGALSETDIRHMAKGQMLCLLDGQNPIIVDGIPYYDYSNNT